MYRGGKLIVTISGSKADPLRDRLGHDDHEYHQILARLTSNDKLGNQRRSGSKRN